MASTLDGVKATSKSGNQRAENAREIHLPFWFEVIGILINYYVDTDALQLVIDNETLIYPTDSDEAKYLQEKLDASQIGRRIAVLRTDLPDNPLLIRLVD